MDIAVHITFYYVESRLEYINRIIKNLSAIPHNIKVFIYSNKRFDLQSTFENMGVEVIPFNFLDNKRRMTSLYRYIPVMLIQYVDPYYLAWKNRRYVKRLVDQYDIQIYLEDDIGFTNRTFEYFLDYKDTCISNNYNLGFLRFEVDKNSNRLFCTDLYKAPLKTINIENQIFLLNDINVYCGFWIYDKEELKRFMKSKEWSFKFKEYRIREKSAIGWHGVNMTRYRGTVIPLKALEDNTYVTHDDCKVHHFPDNYIGNGWYCSVEFPIQLKVETQI